MQHLAVRVAAVLLPVIAIAALTGPALGQPAEEEFDRPFLDEPVTGYERSDDIVVLEDEGFCSHLLGAIWSDRELTFRDLINKSRQQKPAKREAFAPVSDPDTLAACVSALNAFREEPSVGDGIADWAREHVVLPAAFAALLPADPETDPLATPPPPGDGSRTGGFGNRTSAPFTLWDGDYYIEPDTGTCGSWTGTIRRLDDHSVVLATVSEPANLYDVAMANYFWDVTADDCDWSVDIVAVAPIPDPTPTPTPLVAVPQLVGDEPWQAQSENPEYLTVEQARDALMAAGLVVGDCEEVSFRIEAPRRVVAQDPAPGTMVEPGSAVDVQVRESGCAELAAP